MTSKLASAIQIAAIALILALGLMTIAVLAILLLQGRIALDILTTLLGVVLGFVGHALGVQTGATAALSQSPNTTTVSSTQPVAVVPVNVTQQQQAAPPPSNIPPVQTAPLQGTTTSPQGPPQSVQWPMPGATPATPIG